MLSMSVYSQNNFVNDTVITNTIENLDNYQCTVDSVIIDNHVIIKTIIKDYSYNNLVGTLMLMQTKNTLFGIKFRSTNGNEMCWFYLNHNVSRSEDLWGDITFN